MTSSTDRRRACRRPLMFANLRDPASGLMHFFAAIIAVASVVVLLVVGWPSVVKVISLGIYGTSLVLLFGASAAYHMVKAGPTALVVLRKLDKLGPG